MRIFRKKCKVIPPDRFIRRLKSSVIGEGMLTEGNIYLFDLALKSIPSEGSVIEIGSYGGLSTNLTTYLLQKYNKSNPFFTCDAWLYEGYDDHSGLSSEYVDGRIDLARTSYMDHIKQSFIHSTLLLSANKLPYSIHSTSEFFFEHWQLNKKAIDVFGRTCQLGGDICFAYIDGDHSLAAAGLDFDNVCRHLVKGGYILFDDSADHLNFGSAKLMNKIKDDSRFEVVMKNPNYLLRKK